MSCTKFCVEAIIFKLSCILAVQLPDGLWVESVPESAAVSLDVPIPPAWRQEHEECIAGAAGIRVDLLGLPPTALSLDILDGKLFSIPEHCNCRTRSQPGRILLVVHW